MNLETITIDRITDLLLHQEFHVKVNFTEKIWSNDELIELFIKYGYFDFPDPGMNNAERKEYVNNGLKKLNGTKSLKKLIEYIADPRVYISKGISIEDVINYLNKLLIYDGYVLMEERHKYVVTKLPGVGVEKSAEQKQPSVFTKVDDWNQLNVYLKKSDIRYIRFEYPPNEYDNNTLKTNKLKAGGTQFTGTRGKNQPYKIMEYFIDSERIERFDELTEHSRTKIISRLNQFFKYSFNNLSSPITSDQDGLYGYTTPIKFRYES